MHLKWEICESFLSWDFPIYGTFQYSLLHCILTYLASPTCVKLALVTAKCCECILCCFLLT